MRERVTHDTSWVEKGFVDDSELRNKGLIVKDLMFYITQGCDLRCITCYVGNGWLATGETYSKAEADLILKHFCTPGLDRLTFLGGEPTLHPNITELILYANEFDIKEKRITTNAVTLGNLDLDRLRGNELGQISISLDGATKETHEKIHGKGTFDKTVANIKRLIQRGFPVSMNFTVNGVNKHEVVDAVRVFSGLGASEVNFHLVTMIGNAERHPELAVEPKEWVRIRKELESVSGVSGITLRVPLMFVTPEEYKNLMINRNYQPFQRLSYHSETGQRIVLYPNGKVYMSCDLTGTDYNFATFRDGVFKLNDGINELTFFEQNPENPDVSGDLLALDKQGFTRLSISYKEKIEL